MTLRLQVQPTGPQEQQHRLRASSCFCDCWVVEYLLIKQEVIGSLVQVECPSPGLSKRIPVILSYDQLPLFDLVDHMLLLPLPSRQPLIRLDQHDRVGNVVHDVPDLLQPLLGRIAAQLVDQLLDAPLLGVLGQVLEGVVQAHVVLLVGGVLGLHEVEALLVADVDVEAHHSHEHHRDVELETDRGELLVVLVYQVVGYYQRVVLQLLGRANEFRRSTAEGPPHHVVRVHLDEVLHQRLGLSFPHVLRREEETRRQVRNLHSALVPDVHVPHSRQHQILDGLDAGPVGAQQGDSRLRQLLLAPVAPQPDLPVVLVDLHAETSKIFYSPEGGGAVLQYPSSSIDMKSYCTAAPLLALLLAQCLASAVNTTSFWQQAMNETDLHFEAFSGFQEIDQYFPKGESGMYYSLFGASFKSLNQSSKVPLIIWLNGGPGSSSHFGAFMEIGPVRILNKKPVRFSYPWNNQGHLLFIDQPLNVGFSFQGDRTGKKQVGTSNEAAKHLLNFLENFYKEWPQLKSSPLFVTGESFAGHYIPAFVSEFIIQDYEEKLGVRLEGVAIGDGWVDPINQVNYYDSLLYSAGIVSNKFRDVCTWMQTQSIVNIYKGDFVNATSYWDFLTNDENTWKTYLGGMSEFNFRQFEDLDTSFAAFLEQNKKSLGVTSSISYIPGNDMVYESFHADISTSYTFQVNVMLRHVRVLFYNGQEDYVVNTAGVLNYLNSLSWEGLANWKRARKEVWTVNGLIKGWAKVSGNMWFVLVNRAGHMVPTDNPSAAFSMFEHFIQNDRHWDQ